MIQGIVLRLSLNWYFLEESFVALIVLPQGDQHGFSWPQEVKEAVLAIISSLTLRLKMTATDLAFRWCRLLVLVL